MPTKITGLTAAQGMKNIGDISREDAIETLKQLKGQLQDGKGGFKSGVLKLMHTTSKTKTMSFERKDSWQWFARRGSKMKNTYTAIDQLMESAKCSGKTRALFEAYADLNNNEIGGSRAVDHLEAAIADAEARQQSEIANRIRGLVTTKIGTDDATASRRVDDCLKIVRDTDKHALSVFRLNTTQGMKSGTSFFNMVWDDPSILVSCEGGMKFDSARINAQVPNRLKLAGEKIYQDVSPSPESGQDTYSADDIATLKRSVSKEHFAAGAKKLYDWFLADFNNSTPTTKESFAQKATIHEEMFGLTPLNEQLKADITRELEHIAHQYAKFTFGGSSKERFLKAEETLKGFVEQAQDERKKKGLDSAQPSSKSLFEENGEMTREWSRWFKESLGEKKGEMDSYKLTSDTAKKYQRAVKVRQTVYKEYLGAQQPEILDQLSKFVTACKQKQLTIEQSSSLTQLADFSDEDASNVKAAIDRVFHHPDQSTQADYVLIKRFTQEGAT